MFSLVNVLSRISKLFGSTVQAEDVDQTAELPIANVTDESKSCLSDSTNIEHVPAASMVDSTLLSAQYGYDTPCQNHLILDTLRISDSEDWDEEIDSMRTTTYSSELSCEYDQGSFKEHQNTEYSVPNSKAVVFDKLLEEVTRQTNFKMPQTVPIEKQKYFDDERFLQESTHVSKSHFNSGEENSSMSAQKRPQYEPNYGEEMAYYSSEAEFNHVSQYNDVHAKNPWSQRQEIGNMNIFSEENSFNTSLPRETKSCFEANIISERQFAPDESGSHVQESIQHDVLSSEQLSSSHEQSSDYENVFEWDFMEKLTILESVFTQEDRGKFVEVLKETLRNEPSPYSLLLYLVENHYSNVLEGKKSMVHVALTQFSNWRSQGLFANSYPSEMEKDRALWIVSTRKLYLFDLCNKVFMLDSKGNEYLQRHVYYLLRSKKRYKEAVTVATKLNLQPCFEPMEILFPLVILNKVQLAESYIASCPWQQRAFVSMLDKLCLMSDHQLDELTSEIVPAKPSSNKVTQASLKKLGERIVKKFNLEPDDFPELFKAKNAKSLAYLLHQRQKDKRGSSKKWDDLIERCVGNSVLLQQSLVDLLTEFGDKDDARRWARFYQLSPEKQSDFPAPDLNSKQEDWESEIEEKDAIFDRTRDQWNMKSSILRAESGQYRQSVEYLALDVPMENIYFVDNAESLRFCQRALSKHEVTVGFDAEWKPQMCQAGLPQRLSIVQLSFRDRVFILDVIALADHVPQSSLLAFGNALFANEHVLKLGFGVESDFKALITTLPILEKSIKNMRRFIDLCTLSQKLFEVPVIKKKVEKITQSLTSFGLLTEKGLSLVVQQTLGLPLDKTYQLSDWEQRPLLAKQVEYAALDARCLIDVFDVLKKWTVEENIKIDLKECTPKLPWLFPKRSRKPKGKGLKHPKPGTSSVELEQLNEPAVKGPPNSSQNFRVVVDNMLQGLGRYLRCCGVDVVVLANEDHHDKAAKIAIREDRVILTTGTPYYTLRSQVPLGRCMCVPVGSAKEQVMAVFKHFNIKVNTSDIFSRCQVCNGNEYIKVGSILMRQAYINYYEGEHDSCVANTPVESRAHSTKANSNHLENSPTLLSPLNVDTLMLRSGVRLQIEAIPEGVLDKVELFYCCATCGKIFWEGGHFSRICTQFSDVLNNTGTVYQGQSDSR